MDVSAWRALVEEGGEALAEGRVAEGVATGEELLVGAAFVGASAGVFGGAERFAGILWRRA
jgi:hypothetical protein